MLDLFFAQSAVVSRMSSSAPRPTECYRSFLCTGENEGDKAAQGKGTFVQMGSSRIAVIQVGKNRGCRRANTNET